MGSIPPSRKRKWRDLEERISNMEAQLARGDRTLDGYWRANDGILKSVFNETILTKVLQMAFSIHSMSWYQVRIIKAAFF